MKLFTGLTRTAQVMIAWVVAVCVVILAVGLLGIHFIHPFEGSMPFMTGLALGCLHSIAKVIILEKSINKILDLEESGSAQGLSRAHFFGRYALTAVVFIIAMMLPDIFGLFGTIAGVLSLQLAGHITGQVLRDKTIK